MREVRDWLCYHANEIKTRVLNKRGGAGRPNLDIESENGDRSGELGQRVVFGVS